MTDLAQRTVLRGARVIDGTGGPERSGDVVIQGDRIVSVDPAGSGVGENVVDLEGLVLAPGFIDVHTHYDAQLYWDPDLSPSSWHGVTSVVMGNCGFGISPTRVNDRETIIRTLENVEGMSGDALRSGMHWGFETFPEYIKVLKELPKRMNVAVLVGHTPVRQYVMGDDASERAASPAEISSMRSIVGEAIDLGAVGFATSKSPSHFGDKGRPVPSAFAEAAEITEIARALQERDKGVVQVTRGADFFVNELAELAQEIGRPVIWTSLFTNSTWGSASELVDRQDRLGGEVWPQMSCRPLVMQVDLLNPYPFGNIAAFKELLAEPPNRRATLYADPAWRDRARPFLADLWGDRLGQATIQESERHTLLKNGPTLDELARARGVDSFDLLCDLSLEEDLRTKFRIVLANDDEEELALLLKDERVLLGLSDAGAHASQICDACFSTYLLGYWVRERKALSVEQAVWRMTGHPASVFRLGDRGQIQRGFAADLVAFDANTVGVEELERTFDLPAGADRLIAKSRGIEKVWIGGALSRDGGADLPLVHNGTLLTPSQ